MCIRDRYYGMQGTFDELYQKSQNGEVCENLMDLILSRDNILLAYRNIKANKGSYTAGTDKKNITELDAATLNRLIKEIVVHERIDEDKTRHISIEIHFNRKPIPEVEQVTA